MITINRANERREFGRSDDFRIKSTFPAIHLNNPNDLGLAQLGRIDYSEIKEGFVVKMHPHKNDEIFSYIRSGTMTHEDTNGNIVEIGADNLMLMNAGSGIFHKETVPKDSENVEMIQIFMRPNEYNLEPNVQFLKLENRYSINSWRLVAGSPSSDAPLKINGEVNIYDNRITTANILDVANNKIGFLYIFDGDIKIGNNFLYKGDSAVLDEKITIDVSVSPTADLVYFELDQSSK